MNRRLVVFTWSRPGGEAIHDEMATGLRSCLPHRLRPPRLTQPATRQARAENVYAEKKTIIISYKDGWGE